MPNRLVMPSLVHAYRAWHRGSLARYWLAVTTERIVATLAAGMIATYVFHLPPRLDLKGMTPAYLVGFVGVGAPLIETLLFQALPYAVAQHFTRRTPFLVSACWLPFAFAHLRVGFGTFVCAGLVSGFFLGLMYVELRPRSLAHAVLLTAASHATLNLIAVAVMIAQR